MGMEIDLFLSRCVSAFCSMSSYSLYMSLLLQRDYKEILLVLYVVKSVANIYITSVRGPP